VLHLGAGLAGLAGAVLVGLLWASEPGPLPVRTQVAFAGLVVVGLAWAGFAGWALARRPLFALDRVVAGLLALAVSALTTAGAVALAVARGGTGLWLAAVGLGVGLITVSTAILARAYRHRRELLARLRELERRAAGPSPPSAAGGVAAGGVARSGLAPGGPAPAASAGRLRPVGPLAIALRHLHPDAAGRRYAGVIALVLGLAALVGLALLLR
jgi:hypothetical protein